MLNKLRNVVNKYPLPASAALLLFLVAIAWNLLPRTPQLPAANAWFYELDTGEVFLHSDVVPDRVKSPKGGRSARAFMFACGDCSEKEKRFVGWLETEAMAEGTDEHTWRIARLSPMGDEGEGAAVRLLARLPNEQSWSGRNERLIESYRTKVADSCKGLAPLTPCPAIAPKR